MDSTVTFLLPLKKTHTLNQEIIILQKLGSYSYSCFSKVEIYKRLQTAAGVKQKPC